MARNTRALPPPTPYDTLRAQYPTLRYLNAAGWRLAQLMPYQNQDGMDMIVRVATAVWRLLDRSIVDLDAGLAADALCGMAGLADAWLNLRQTAILTLAKSSARQTLTMSGEGMQMLNTIETELFAQTYRPAALWFDRASVILHGLTAGGA